MVTTNRKPYNIAASYSQAANIIAHEKGQGFTFYAQPQLANFLVIFVAYI